jgi:hypothetical protein
MRHGLVIDPPFELSRAASGEAKAQLIRPEPGRVRRNEKA